MRHVLREKKEPYLVQPENHRTYVIIVIIMVAEYNRNRGTHANRVGNNSEHEYARVPSIFLPARQKQKSVRKILCSVRGLRVLMT